MIGLRDIRRLAGITEKKLGDVPPKMLSDLNAVLKSFERDYSFHELVWMQRTKPFTVDEKQSNKITVSADTDVEVEKKVPREFEGKMRDEFWADFELEVRPKLIEVVRRYYPEADIDTYISDTVEITISN